MKEVKKQPYVKPTIEIAYLEIEESIAASSSTVSISTPGQAYQPEVEDWTTGFSGTQQIEF